MLAISKRLRQPTPGEIGEANHPRAGKAEPRARTGAPAASLTGRASRPVIATTQKPSDFPLKANKTSSAQYPGVGGPASQTEIQQAQNTSHSRHLRTLAPPPASAVRRAMDRRAASGQQAPRDVATASKAYCGRLREVNQQAHISIPAAEAVIQKRRPSPALSLIQAG